MEIFMKIYTINPTTVLSRWTRFLGAILTVALLMPVAAMSQSTAVNLRTAGDFAILAKTGISTTGVTSITGDIGVSPAAATYITGFGLIMGVDSTYSTSSLVTGRVYAADYKPPTPTKMTTAVGDMQTAYTDAAGRTLPDSIDLGAGDITGKTIRHGLYKWGTSVLISAGGVTISGSATDVWVFQIAQDLTVANGAIVTLSGGAKSSNIFWQVAGQVNLGTTVQMKGVILCQTLIAMNTGATLDGRALAQSAVTLQANTVVVKPAVTAVKNVTFILNTATVPDTLPVSGSTVQIRGGLVNSGTVSITWGNDSVNNMTNIGGDYWSKTITLNTNDTLRYKFAIIYPGNTGYEQNTTPPYAGMPADNRYFIVGTGDTTLPLEFWNNGASGRPQYFRPWNDHAADTMVVYFRVNMLGPMTSGTFSFKNDVDTVGVRGGDSKGLGELHWSPTFYLTKESNPSNGAGYTVPASSFWSGAVRIPTDSVNVGQTINYKFLIGYDWGRDELGGHPNRSFVVPTGKKDTTLQWVFYNNERPSARVNTDTAIITFRCDMAKAISTGGFTPGDTLYVRSGYFATSTNAGQKPVKMQNLISSIYQGKDTVITKIGSPLDYQYYAVKNASEIRENYYNFYYNGLTTSEAERRQFTVLNSKAFSILDTATSYVQARRQPVFPNARLLARKVLVTYEVNVKPVFYQVMKGDTLHDIQGLFNIHQGNIDSILTRYGVWMNGPAVGGWNNAGTDWDYGLLNNPNKKMYDDGTHGDAVANDTIFTLQVQCAPESAAIGSKGYVGQTFKFGVRGGDNEGGKGGYGNNHLENIVDTDSLYTIHSQFGSINPAFYSAWDYDHERPASLVAVKETKGLPLVYRLTQNYPNPFNPSTKIDYAIPTAGIVTLKIYNVLGQELATLVNEKKDPGTYHVTFDGAKFTSGVYFYRLSAGSFVSVKKMLLLK
jgi:hypothetical protein